MGGELEQTPMVASESGTPFGGIALAASRIAALSLALIFNGILIYTIATDGSPFRLELLTPWMTTTILDYYFSAAPFYCWIFLRERALWRAICWIVACICLGSGVVWIYVWIALLAHRPTLPISAFLLGSLAR